MLSSDRIRLLLEPYLGDSFFAALEASPANAFSEPADWEKVYGRLATYLDLILKWNARLNLTAIRAPEEIVQRHFGESLFAAAYAGSAKSLLDFGSGAGFPGIPIQIVRADLHVTLAESQSKKASFLREVIRVLELEVEVWPHRVEAMPRDRRFDLVALRAVDKMSLAVAEAGLRTRDSLLIFGTDASAFRAELSSFSHWETISVPQLRNGKLFLIRR